MACTKAPYGQCLGRPAWTESGNRTGNPCKSCAGKILSLSMISAGPSAPTTMAKLLTAWPRKRASAKSTRICFATPLSVSCSPTRISVSLRWRPRRPCPAQHDTGNLYAGLPQAAGFHPQPDERDALQEKNSRKMKRDVQTLRLHVSFWWAMQDSNPAITRL